MNRPNILLLHTDQQRFDTIHALGAKHMITPNLDRLVERGTACVRAYSANPVCMPARHDLITGVSARHHGYWGNCGDPIRDYALPTLPRMLTADGYQTFAVGKMHFHPEREHHGFAHMFLMEELPSCRENDAYLQYLESVGHGNVRCQHGVRPLFYHTPQKCRIPEEHHGSAWIAHKTIELLETERDRPWFIFSSWVGPHPPYYMPEKYLSMYSGADLPEPCPLPEDWAGRPPPTPDNAGPERLRLIREAYCGATTLIDHHLGRILDALERTGQLDNTLIIFTSDHGEMLGDRGYYQKHVPYEGSARIPMLVAGPGVKAGICTAPTTTWDISATILDAAKVRVPAGHPLVGSSLLAPLADDRIVCYSNAGGLGRYVAAVDRQYKYIHWYGCRDEMYDLENDPWEQHDLLQGTGEPQTDLARSLRSACVRFEEEHGIAENIENHDFRDLGAIDWDRHATSLYPEWSSQQFPQWMNGYSKEDLDLIIAQMRACMDEPGAYVFADPEWREQAMEKWKSIGGDPALYREIFAEMDQRVSDRDIGSMS